MHDVNMPTRGGAAIRTELAHVAGVPKEQLRVHARDVGGAFGVRNEIYSEFAAVLLAARSLGRPVKSRRTDGSAASRQIGSARGHQLARRSTSRGAFHRQYARPACCPPASGPGRSRL